LNLSLFGRATRAKVLPVMLAPVAVGSTLGWERSGRFSWGWFGLTVAGAAAMHLGANVVNDYFDEELGAEEEARRDPGMIATGSGVVAAGQMTKAGLAFLAASLFTLALAIGIVLAVARGWEVFALGAIGFVLAFTYVAPPVKYGYRGRGLGEAGIFCAFGLLPVAGSYFVQAQRIDATAVWASLIPGLAITLVLFHHHFLHWRSDAAAGKMTPVASLGVQPALLVGKVVVGAIVVILVAQVFAGLWPPGAAAAALMAAPIIAANERAADQPGTESFMRLLGSSLGAAVGMSLILVVSLVVRVALR
jgi:1,4-dihydroxy-2-naphthoate polyprenyltransferase